VQEDGGAHLPTPPPRLAALVRAVGGVLFLATFACFVTQVTMRYVFNHPQAWTDELAVVLFVWLACWTAAMMTPWSEHVTLDVLVVAVPPPLRRAMIATGMLALAALFIAALPATYDLWRFMLRRRTPVLGINMAVVLAPFLLFLTAFALRALWRAFLELRGR
jgi:TRAP-type transport system small permease protein